MEGTQLEVERYCEGVTAEHRGHVPHFVLHGAIVKSCARCARVLPLESFPDNAKTWDGSSAKCADCLAAEPGFLQLHIAASETAQTPGGSTTATEPATRGRSIAGTPLRSGTGGSSSSGISIRHAPEWAKEPGGRR